MWIMFVHQQSSKMCYRFGVCSSLYAINSVNNQLNHPIKVGLPLVVSCPNYGQILEKIMTTHTPIHPRHLIYIIINMINVLYIDVL